MRSTLLLRRLRRSRPASIPLCSPKMGSPATACIAGSSAASSSCRPRLASATAGTADGIAAGIAAGIASIAAAAAAGAPAAFALTALSPCSCCSAAAHAGRRFPASRFGAAASASAPPSVPSLSLSCGARASPQSLACSTRNVLS